MALQISQAIDNERDRAEALEALAPYLPAELLQTIVDEARAINNEFYRSTVMLAVAESLSSLDNIETSNPETEIKVTDLFEGLMRERTLEILAATARTIDIQFGAEAILACCDAVTDVCNWWP